MTSFVVSFKPNWLNGWWLRVFTDPYVQVDATVIQCSWSTSSKIESTPGTHRLRTFVRYRRLIPGDGGCGEGDVVLGAGEDLDVIASNWITNQSPFMPRATR